MVILPLFGMMQDGLEDALVIRGEPEATFTVFLKIQPALSDTVTL